MKHMDVRVRRSVLALLFVVGVFPLVPSLVSGAPAGFVTASGGRLMLDGQPWRAIGVNLWDMNPYKALSNDLSGCYYQHPDLDSYFDATFRRISLEMRATVVRTFGFREQYTAQGGDWSSTDKLLHYAQKHNIRIIPVLGDQYTTCGIPARTPDWYYCTEPGCVPGYRKPNIWGGDFRSYVVDVANRYKDNPTIAFWQIMNEPMYSKFAFDPRALVDFSRDMVGAIREDAGDTDHLINLGTSQGSPDPLAVASMLDCPATGTGGCQDLTEVHDYSRQALEGTPMPASVIGRVRLSNSYDRDHFSGTFSPKIDGWTTMKVPVPDTPSHLPHLYWSVHIYTPSNPPAWTMYVDDVILNTLAGPTIYSFETGTDGFDADSGATVERSTRYPKTGFGSLRVDVPAGRTEIQIVPPILPAPAQSIEISFRMAFSGPAPDAAKGVAQSLHTSVIAKGKPFVSGEVGMPAMVANGVDPAPLFRPECIPNITLDQRAAKFDEMLSLQTDDEHISSGLIFWDYKDPMMLVTKPDGSQIADPYISYYTILPTDPAVKVISRHALVAGASPLPPPAPLGPDLPSLVWLKKPPAQVGAGSTVPLQARVTRGGDAVKDARVLASGACAGEAKTDALGMAIFSCKAATGHGAGIVTLAVDPSTCCTVPTLDAPVVIRRGVKLTAAAEVTELGRPVRVGVVLRSSDGGSMRGTTWEIPECGLLGTIAGDEPSVLVDAVCPPGSVEDAGLSGLFVTATDPDGVVSSQSFNVLLFERIYHDAGTNDCVGLAPESGWIGATENSHLCGSTGGGTPSNWFSFKVPEASRGSTFAKAGDDMIVSANSPAGRLIFGIFDYDDSGSRGFIAAVTRKDGTKVYRSP